VPATGEQYRRYFPGLKPDEDRIWRVFLHAYEGRFTRFYYNLYLGEGGQASPSALAPYPELADAHREWWRNLTRRKADVLALAEDGEWWIIEVKYRARPSILGQVLIYDQLLKPTHGIEADVLAVVCVDIGQDVADLLAEHDVFVYQVQLPLARVTRVGG